METTKKRRAWRARSVADHTRRYRVGERIAANAAVLLLDCSLAQLPGHTVAERRATSPRAGVSWTVVGGAETATLADQGYEVRFTRGGAICRMPHKFRSRDLTVTHADHRLSVLSLAVVVGDGESCEWAVGRRTGTATAPAGWRWDVDAHGLRIVSVSDPDMDYHPTGADMLAPGAVDAVTMATANAVARRKAEAAVAVVGVYVCAADSLRGGNCLAGTLAWVRERGLTTTAHVEASTLPADDRRVRAAISAAAERTAREMARGYSDLTDHRLMLA